MKRKRGVKIQNEEKTGIPDDAKMVRIRAQA
jgi:hypothetical protein